MKNFDEWNNLKKEIDGQDSDLVTKYKKNIAYFNERDIVWVSCGLNVGVESDGKGDMYLRPALIIRKLNKNHYIILFCTTSQKENKYYCKINSDNKLLKDTKVILTQIKTVDKKRLVERLVTLSEKDFLEVRDKFVSIINNSPSPFGEGEANAHK